MIFFFKKKNAAILQCFLKIHGEAFDTSSFLLFRSFLLLLHFLLFRPVRPTLCKLHILSVLWNCGTTYAMKPSLVVLLHVRELSRNQPIHGFDVVLQHNWPIKQCLLHIRVFFGGKTKRPCFDHSSIGW